MFEALLLSTAKTLACNVRCRLKQVHSCRMLPSAKRAITSVSNLTLSRFASSCCAHTPLKAHTSAKHVIRSATTAIEQNAEGNEEGATEVPGMAFNPVVKKKYLQRPTHTLEEQIKYMNSQGKWEHA